MKKMFVALVLALSVTATAAYAGKQPKWDEFYSAYKSAVKRADGNKAKIGKLDAIKSQAYREMTRMERVEFYKYADQKKAELARVAK